MPLTVDWHVFVHVCGCVSACVGVDCLVCCLLLLKCEHNDQLFKQISFIGKRCTVHECVCACMCVDGFICCVLLLKYEHNNQVYIFFYRETFCYV